MPGEYCAAHVYVHLHRHAWLDSINAIDLNKEVITQYWGGFACICNRLTFLLDTIRIVDVLSNFHLIFTAWEYWDTEVTWWVWPNRKILILCWSKMEGFFFCFVLFFKIFLNLGWCLYSELVILLQHVRIRAFDFLTCIINDLRKKKNHICTSAVLGFSSSDQ